MGTILNGKKYPVEIRDRALSLYWAGKPIAEIAIALGISKRVIYNWVGDARDAPKPSGHFVRCQNVDCARDARDAVKYQAQQYPDEIRLRAIALHGQGIAFGEIAARLKVNELSVWAWLKIRSIGSRSEKLPKTVSLKIR